MNKIKKLLLALLVTIPLISSFAQKVKIEKEKVKLELNKSDFFKNLKTYNIIVQKGNWGGNFLSSGSSGEEFAHPETKTYEHLMSDKFLEEIELKRDTINPDIKIYVGFNGAKPRISNNQLLLEGYFRYLVLDSKNKLLFQNHEKLNAYFINYKDEYPNGGGKNYHIKMTNILKRYALNKLENLSLTSNYLEDDIPYGIFTKYKKMPELDEFNSKVKELVGKIKNSILTDEESKNYKEYFKSYESKRIGKLKDKKKNQILVLNISLVDLFSGNNNAFLETINNVKVGFFTTWPTELKGIFKKMNLLANYNDLGITINDYPNLVNAMLIKDAKVKHGDKEYMGDITIERFLESDGGLNITQAPTVYILDENGAWTNHFKGNDDVQIKLSDETILEFKKVDTIFLLVEKLDSDNCSKIFKMFDNRNGKVCKEGDKFKFVKY